MSSQWLYVFLTRRPQDKEAWPQVYRDEALALKAPYRVSGVKAVQIEEEGSPRLDTGTAPDICDCPEVCQHCGGRAAACAHLGCRSDRSIGWHECPSTNI